MNLLVDIGNSRVKWATLDHGVLGPQSAADHSAWGLAEWRTELARIAPHRVIAACVGAGAARDALTAATRAALGRDPEFVIATEYAAGVRNGYANPGQLGVDRWLAVIGAFKRYRTACCVIDAGTALTVDAIDADGQHLGGFIVPGPRLMVRSLHIGTTDLADRSAWGGSADPTRFPTNTREAIEQGCLVALARLVDDAIDRLTERAGQPPKLVLTGGDAALLMPVLRRPVDIVPDLVLQGLACFS